ncbi:sodium:solute symporter family protein [Paraglaciecola polaris]|uniref:Na+/solute symporter n=1 Tax=Paraglaciecola polaris LMG 21857 TaxID=1129793 RepID=K6Z540_9ALTE|nr:sodium:solute symporter family protein [Paraglaciecola polaris]GAC31296.1 Na+/solute symporter [Paraglaciecola polaris LMG 21857]|tara:strand:- start:18077 stop:19942 length:1866 start_codon:yes stop_codon:yes gene_type:complete
MILSVLDISIIAAYLLAIVALGLYISKSAGKNVQSYFLGGNQLRWQLLGLSNASGMFDISGTMWMVYLLFIYGLKSVYIPWLWPSFNQIFLMVFLSIWLRRSGVMTGAEWIRFRFGESRGATLSHFVVVLFALLSVLGFLAYGFIGIGKFAAAFLPWELSLDPRTNEIYYGLIMTALTSVYVVKGGMVSVVFTEVLQFVIMTVACIAIGIVAMMKVSPQMLAQVTPNGWDSLAFGWNLSLDWSAILAQANQRIIEDGWSLFSVFIMLVLFKGILQSMAGPAPNFDMQRVLSARTPSEAAKMSGFVSLVLLVPRYMMITGLAVLALVYFMPALNAMGPDVDFEQILPFTLANFIPSGLLGLIIAGLLATFMSTFAATTNAAPAYVVNDIYRRYINPDASARTYVRMSYLVSVVFIVLGTAIGLFIPSLNAIVLWLVSALYGGYTASNLLKWYWWRFNGMAYFAGMSAGILAAIPMMFTDISPLYGFPFMFAACLATCIVVSYISAPDDIEVVKHFYLKTRPWGIWGPIIAAVQKDNPNIRPNTEFKKDLGNVVVGIIWHTSLTAAPIFLVIQHWGGLTIATGVAIISSILLKYFWWDTLSDEPQEQHTLHQPSVYSPAQQGK